MLYAIAMGQIIIVPSSRLVINQSINQSIFIYIRQAEPIVARPIHIERKRAHTKRQAWCLLQVKLCDPCLSALKWFVYHARRYTSARLYLFALRLHNTVQNYHTDKRCTWHVQLYVIWHVQFHTIILHAGCA